MKNTINFTKEIIKLNNVEDIVNKITTKLKEDIVKVLKRHGAVVGISGGIDSSVTLALTVNAIGADKVLGILMPEKDSSDESESLALELAQKFRVRTIKENITNALNGFKCYERRDEAVKRVFPEYSPISHKMKIGVNKTGLNQNLPPYFSLSIIDQNGDVKSKRLPIAEYLQIVASSNFKQRSRMSTLYYHAEANHYAVIGTPNKHEVEQGFFVKYGDGGADIMPISSLYKSQVYELADYLEVPHNIITRTPTTDTYTAEQTQEEFFFQMPFKEMDILWYAYENEFDLGMVARELGKTEKDLEIIFINFTRKRKTTEYLRMNPIKDF